MKNQTTKSAASETAKETFDKVNTRQALPNGNSKNTFVAVHEESAYETTDEKKIISPSKDSDSKRDSSR